MGDMYGPSPRSAGLAAALQGLSSGIPLYHKLKQDEEEQYWRQKKYELELEQQRLQNSQLGLQTRANEELVKKAEFERGLALARATPQGTPFDTGDPYDVATASLGPAARRPRTMEMPFVGTPLSPIPLPEGARPQVPEGPGKFESVTPRDYIAERQVAVQEARNRVRTQEMETRYKFQREIEQLRELGRQRHDRASMEMLQQRLAVAREDLEQRYARMEQDAKLFYDEHGEYEPSYRIYEQEMQNYRAQLKGIEEELSNRAMSEAITGQPSTAPLPKRPVAPTYKPPQGVGPTGSAGGGDPLDEALDAIFGAQAKRPAPSTLTPSTRKR